MSVDSDDPVDFLLKLAGLSPSSKWYHQNVLVYTCLPILAVLLILVLMDLQGDMDLAHVAGIFESLSTFGQAIIRLLLVMKHGRLIQNILKDRQNFWPYDACGARMAKSLKSELDMAWFFLKTFWKFTFMTICIILSMPLITDIQKPMRTWTPINQPILLAILYAMDCFGIFLAFFLVIVMDGFFVLLCTELKLQFKLLNQAFEEISFGANDLSNELSELNKIKEYVDFHNLLLRVFNKLNHVCNEFYIGQYAISLIGVCIEMFINIDKTTTLAQRIRSGAYCVALLFQLGLIFIPASNISEEAEDLAYKLFGTKWYLSPNLKFRKHLQFILMKAQRPLYMSGGGMFEINRTVFLQIFRLAYTMAAILERLRNSNNE